MHLLIQTGLVPIFITKTFPRETLQMVWGCIILRNSLANILTIECKALASCSLRELTFKEV